MSEPIRIEGWAIVYDREDGYTPPELNRRCLKGEVYGHPRKANGETVKTSPIVSVDGLHVLTNSGSLYLLGAPRAEWIEWMRENNIAFDPADPIKVRK